MKNYPNGWMSDHDTDSNLYYTFGGKKRLDLFECYLGGCVVVYSHPYQCLTMSCNILDGVIFIDIVRKLLDMNIEYFMTKLYIHHEEIDFMHGGVGYEEKF